MSVKSAERTLQILELFDEVRRPLALTEIARALDTPKSSTFALVNTLLERGYLYRAGHDEGYYPTRRWLHHARRIAASDPIAAELQRALTRLRDASGETAIHAVLANDQSIYIDVVESTGQIRYSARAGEIKPLARSASGRALLGVLPKTERSQVIARAVSADTDGTASAAAILDRVESEKARGWASNRGEYTPEVSSVAAGLLVNGAAHALVIAAPFQRLEGRFDAIGALLHDEALKLTQMFR